MLVGELPSVALKNSTAVRESSQSLNKASERLPIKLGGKSWHASCNSLRVENLPEARTAKTVVSPSAERRITGGVSNEDLISG